MVINANMTDQVIKALCNTLVHSLWQGVLLAIIAGLIVIGTKKTSPALRYNLLITTLIMFTIGVAATFALQFKTGDGVAATHLAIPLQGNTGANPQAANTPARGFTALLSGYLSSYHNTIVLIWFLIICGRSLQLGVGLYGTYRLRRVHVFAADDHWQARLQQLAAMLGIRQTIAFLESGLAKVPMVIGNLKPVILIPIGLLTALSAEEVEAILIHELAHIRRRDYLVNILQSLVEIVFFFNPAVLWISQLIKTERENCCDDLALAQNNDKGNYIRALVSCEKYQPLVPTYAMAFPGSKNKLLDRVKRMAGNSNHSLNVFEKTILAVCLVVSGLCMTAFKAREAIKSSVHAVVSAIHHQEQNNQVVKLVVQPKQADIVAKKTTKPQKAPTALPDTTKSTASTPPIKGDTINEATSVTESGYTKLYSPYGGSRYQRHYSSNYPVDQGYTPAGRRAWARMDSIANATITADLLKDDIITDEHHFSFKLGTKEFVVNGKKQDEAIFQKYKQKYVPSTADNGDWTWTHSLNMPKNNQ